MLIDLAVHPEWREKCNDEIQDLLSRYLGDSPPATLHERLGAIPISAWEDELPILEACIRESQRISMSSVALRRNLREEIKICGRVVKQGDFLAYPMDEVHLNLEYYPEPHKYDPGRWLRPDSIPDAAYTFLGWGAGRHTCTGIKVAKLEMKLILAIFLVRYEFDLVDGDGRFPKVLPVRNRNSIHPVRVVLWTTAFSMNAYRVFPLLSRLVLLELRTTSTLRRLCSRRIIALPHQFRPSLRRSCHESVYSTRFESHKQGVK